MQLGRMQLPAVLMLSVSLLVVVSSQYGEQDARGEWREQITRIRWSTR